MRVRPGLPAAVARLVAPIAEVCSRQHGPFPTLAFPTLALAPLASPPLAPPTLACLTLATRARAIALRAALAGTLAAAFLAAPALAQQEPGDGTEEEVLTPREAFLQANIIAIFYHELGHAVIDLMEVPIFGQEEDAADVMAVLLIDWLFEEEDAQDIAYDSAFGYLGNLAPDAGGAQDDADAQDGEEIAWWALHGPDAQRYYNHICLFYGANPEDREDLALDLGLPEERAETCAEEYDLANDSWGAVFDAMTDLPVSRPMAFDPGDGPDAPFLNKVLAEEIALLAEDMTLPQEVRVVVESCDEANAFYDPEAVTITFCTEFMPHLDAIFARLESGSVDYP